MQIPPSPVTGTPIPVRAALSVVTDADGQIRSCNRAFLELFEPASGQLAGMSFTDALRLTEKQPFREAAARSLQEPQNPCSLELQGRDRHGRRLAMQWELTVLLEASGVPGGFCLQGWEIPSLGRPQQEGLRLDDPLLLGARSLQTFYTMYANIPAVVYEYIFRRDGSEGFNYLSPSVEKVFGVAPAQYMDFQQYLHPEDREIVRLKNAHARQSLEPFHFEGRIQVPGKGTIWHLAQSRFSHYTPQGDIIFSGIIIDLTERKKMEEKLRENEAQLRGLVNSVKDYAIFMLDPRGYVATWNQGAAHITGFAAAEAIGLHYSLFLPSTEGEVPGPDQLLSQTAAAGRCEEEGWRIRKDGSRFWANSILTALYDREGKLSGFQDVTRDISERGQAQQALQESNERYLYAVKATSDAIYEWDLIEGKFHRGEGFFRLFGYRELVLSSSRFEERIHPEDREAVLEGLREAMSHRQSRWEDTYRFLCADNGYKPVLNRACLIHDASGRLVKMIGAIRDLSEQKRLEEKLKQEQEQQKSQIIRAIIEAQENERREISYELHDNINQVLATCKLLLDLAEKNPAASRDYILRCSQNISQIIKEIRHISSSLTPYALRDIGLVDAVRDLADRINETGKLTMVVHIENGFDEQRVSPEIQMSAFRIIQEKTNNVLRHAGASELLIELRLQDGGLLMDLRDNGQGFDRDKIRKGSGLYHIQNRVEHHRGLMTLETAPGKGCHLTVSLPL